MSWSECLRLLEPKLGSVQGVSILDISEDKGFSLISPVWAPVPDFHVRLRIIYVCKLSTAVSTPCSVKSCSPDFSSF